MDVKFSEWSAAARKNLILLLIAVSMALLACPFGQAQKADLPPISTDRPSIATGPILVPAHSLEFENGFGWTRDQSINSGDGPETEMRYGLSNRVELQAYVPNVNWGGGVPGTRLADFSIGAKLQIGSDKQSWPVAIQPSLSFPTGSPDLTSGGVDPTILVATLRNLPRSFQIGGSVNLTSASTNGQARIAQSQLALYLGWCVNAKTCFALEEAPFFSTAQNSNSATTDGSMTMGLTPNTQLDMAVGTTVTNGDRGAYVLLGYSFRFDRLFAGNHRSRTPYTAAPSTITTAAPRISR
ncbi:MAG TPA: transporter [Acidobacteriaceae bacterium]